jgi:hypothetical protein
MSGGGEQPDILSVGILVKERWKVVSVHLLRESGRERENMHKHVHIGGKF